MFQVCFRLETDTRRPQPLPGSGRHLAGCDPRLRTSEGAGSGHPERSILGRSRPSIFRVTGGAASTFAGIAQNDDWLS
jgi:hypothetical protein